MAAFLGQVGRGQVDGHLLGRQREPGGVQGGLHPLAALGHGLVRQSDDVHVHLARRDHDLNVNRHRFDTLK
jgi:hypothetical protein